ncbi:MAG: SDR family NAD(P)-dependent oxidoreductase [Anditalea sp.]
MTLAITGPTSGIGIETVKALAPKFDQIFLLVRNEDKARKLIPDFSPSDTATKFHVVYCDLTDLKSVSSAADFIKGQTSHVDVLINNAGGVLKNRKTTKNGFESTFSINYLGHFLLTKKLLPLLDASPLARVINVSSEAHKMAKPDFDDLQSEKSYSAFKAYTNVKLYNILFTLSLAEKYADNGIHAYALHPGMVKTSFGNDLSGIVKLGKKILELFMISAKKGAKTSIFLATSPSVVNNNGAYFKKSKVTNTSKAAESPQLRNRLWNISEELVKEY